METSVGILVGSMLTDHLRHYHAKQVIGLPPLETVPPITNVVGGLFSTNLRIREKILLLAGRVINLGESCKVKFPSNLGIQTSSSNYSILFTNPKPQITINSLIDLKVDILGFRVSLDQVQVILDGFPDFTVRLQW